MGNRATFALLLVTVAGCVHPPDVTAWDAGIPDPSDASPNPSNAAVGARVAEPRSASATMIAPERAEPRDTPPSASDAAIANAHPPSQPTSIARPFPELALAVKAALCAAARRPMRPGRALCLTVDGEGLVAHGFPAIDRTGRTVALIDREVELCGEGLILLVDARTGEQIDTLRLPVEGNSMGPEFELGDCRFDRREARRINRQLARGGFRSLPFLRPALDETWLAGGGVAVRIEEYTTEESSGVVVIAYDVVSEAELARHPVEAFQGAALMPTGGALVIASMFCGCLCNSTSQIIPAVDHAPIPGQPQAAPTR